MTETRIPKVSEHALLRYLERFYELDLPKLRAEILTPEVCGQIAAGAATVMVQGHRAAVAPDGTILTILPKGAKSRSHLGKPRS